MELTPIRIPGKNARDNTKAGIAARRALKRPSGRPSKSQSTGKSLKVVEANEAAKRSKPRSLKNIKSKRKMSDLEKLPVELLERIFLFCVNFDLPRATPVIAAKLSSEIVYSKTILAAFGPAWYKWYGCSQSLPSDSREHEDDRDLASAVLRCRWANLGRILTAKEAWVQKYAQDRVFKPEYFLKHRVHTSLPEEQIELVDNEPLNPTPKKYFQTDFEEFSAFISERDGDIIHEEINWTIEGDGDINPGVEIPGSLLSGPWTEEMIMYLFWLVKSGGKIDWVNSTSGEASLAGLKTAIRLGDTRAIHLLTWAGQNPCDPDLFLWALRNAGGDKFATIAHLLRFGAASQCVKMAGRVRMQLEEMRDEAERGADSEQLSFLEELSTSKALAELRELWRMRGDS